MDSPAPPETPLTAEPLAIESAVATVAPRPPRIWKFWGTLLWGLFGFVVMFLGQLLVLVWLVMVQPDPISLGLIARIAGDGVTIALSVIMGLPAVVAALWLAIRISRTPFADYLAIRRLAGRDLAIGVVSLVVLVLAWEALGQWIGHESSPQFMGDVFKSARADNALWLLVIAFAVAAPMSEELLARGFLYRGWSESFLRPVGAIILSSMAWTAVHIQYSSDWFLFSEVFSIGLLFGYLRYRSHSIWLTIILHGLNNFAAFAQSYVVAGSN